ncbi:hypothetical protein FSW04_04740 [Baekduia soli]|uniref:Hydantoinase B/oxoprolinase domain-containing protein n=1 Tax=Baekduia soli TaxID=496014 RepID=A0A5B8U1K8_9ACTN|nr:hydantoinase B/oxoprolinase family protein [Baekduia soli]QEC46964.1 hypothetical protein FSW04_04740 [Baekduia soli]
MSLLINVEDVENWYPLMYLYRRDLPDSGGAGRQRAGTGFAYAFMPYKAQTMSVANFGAGMTLSATCAPGTQGGLPCPSNHALVRRDTDIHARFAESRLPTDVADLQAGSTFTRPKQGNEMPLGPDDVIEYIVGGGGGYGDPLEREPERVAADVHEGRTSIEAARRHYGVELDATGAVDADATACARTAIRRARKVWPRAADRFPEADPADPVAATGGPPRRLHEAIVARDDGGRRVLACARCDAVLCDYAADFKRHVLLHEGPTTELVGAKADPVDRLDVPIVLRQYCCPGCAVLLTTDVSRAADEPWADMRLAGPG